VDVSKQVEYWRTQAPQDWRVAAKLVTEGELRHGLFFVHLALEKVLKAHVCRAIEDIAPYIHNLVRLADLARLNLTPEQLRVLTEANSFNIQCRYPETLLPTPAREEAVQCLEEAKEVFQWLMKQL
jgi:HEPN domain-containing protein